MSSSSNAHLKEVGHNQDAPHAITNLSERGESHEYEDQDEDGDVDFNPIEAPSPEASSSLSSEVEVFDADVVDSNGNTIESVGTGSSKLSDDVQGSPGGDSEHGEYEIVMQASVSPGGLCKNELDTHMPEKVRKRKSVVFSEPGIENLHVHENVASSETDTNNEVGIRKLSSTMQYRNPLIDFDDEDAICKRTRARYSLASFTLDELETFLQETDDEDDLHNVDDEEEYRKFLAAVLLGGDGDSLADQETENVDDEDNDADFEIEIEEALESDLDENICDKTEKEEYKETIRRPETRQNKRQKASGNNQRKLIQQARRPLRPLVPTMPNASFAPLHSFDGRSLMPEAAPQCLSSSAKDGFISGFTPHQIGHLHCLIYEHVQLLIQVFSLCALDPSRQHIASQVQGLISEMLQKRNQALAWRNAAYPAFWFRHPYIHPLVPEELPKGNPTQCISESSLTPDAQRDSSSLEMPHLHYISPSEGRYEGVFREQTGCSQTIEGFSWLPFIGGPLLSIMDVAPLNLVERYMDDVKIAVQEYRVRLLEDTCDPRVDREPLFPLPSFPSFARASTEVPKGTNPSYADTLPSLSPSHQPPKKSLAATLVESSKKQSVALVPKEIVKLSERFFQLFNPSLFPRNPPPAHVANRVLFTDAEDELLAMGLMEYNTDWKAIQQRFLPCKSKHQIFVRQKNRCSSKAPENPIKAVKRMKNSSLTADEQARIQEGLGIFRLDWMSVWKFMVPHRDPSLLPRQWRIALGTQKSYKIDATKRERRRLYESKRRKSIADSPTWKAVTVREDYRKEILDENNSGEDSIDNEDEAYVHEAFLADWRPGNSSLRVSELPSSSLRDKKLPVDLLNSCASGESQTHKNILKEFPHAHSGPPCTSSHFTQVRYDASNAVKPNILRPDFKSSKTPLYMPPYRTYNAHLVKLAPELPPVNLPLSARVISQSALKSYQCEPSLKVSIAGGSIGGAGIENGVAKIPNTTKAGTTHLMEVRRTRTNSLQHTSTPHPEESGLFRYKCVTEEKGTESDLQMHPLLFQAPDDGHLPYYPLKCSVNSSSFFSRSQPEVSLSLFHNPHQADPTVNCFIKSGKSNETNSTSVGADFHPLLQRTDNGNSDLVAACSTAHLSVDLEPLRSEFAYLQNSSDANQSKSRIICGPSATGSKPHIPNANEKANELDLEIQLSSTSRMDKAIGRNVVTEHNPIGSTVRTPNAETQNSGTPYRGLGATTRSKLVSDAPVLATQSNNISGCIIDNVGDRSHPEIMMEHEELSDSDEEIAGHVEFECEEMADSEGDDGSDCEQIADTQNKETPNYAVDKVSTVADGDNQQCEPSARGDFLGDACIPGKVGTPLILGLTSQGKDIKRSSSWLTLDSCAPFCHPHAKTKHAEIIDSEGPAAKNWNLSRPNRSCKKMKPSAKGATVPKHEVDMPQQLSLGPPSVNTIKRPRKRAGRSNLNLNTEMTVE